MKSKSFWKQKIDPAFNEFIESFINLLKSWGILSNEGYIYLDKDNLYFKVIKKEGFPVFASFYEEANLLNILKEVKKLFNEPNVLYEMNKIFESMTTNKDNRKIKNAIYKMTENMKEESKKYYRKWEEIPTFEENKKKYFHFISDLMSIGYHISTVNDGHENKQINELSTDFI